MQPLNLDIGQARFGVGYSSQFPRGFVRRTDRLRGLHGTAMTIQETENPFERYYLRPPIQLARSMASSIPLDYVEANSLGVACATIVSDNRVYRALALAGHLLGWSPRARQTLSVTSSSRLMSLYCEVCKHLGSHAQLNAREGPGYPLKAHEDGMDDVPNPHIWADMVHPVLLPLRIPPKGRRVLRRI
jgi:hypothetical protein